MNKTYKTEYVVTDGTKFYDIDNYPGPMSSGYPFANTGLGRTTFDKLEDALDVVDQLNKNGMGLPGLAGRDWYVARKVITLERVNDMTMHQAEELVVADASKRGLLVTSVSRRDFITQIRLFYKQGLINLGDLSSDSQIYYAWRKVLKG
ncbi:hypothetical protein SEA_SIXAMA_40 [Gordonia phage Sixama]|uniref:Uncharacterized protein n=1 Tax=Gordonia phage Sixama TaxID=2653271 RepID=A0A5Q2F120_9CAUD|nr:hypothetical protein PP302_gp040 [Gordonia phage Sixama]QGF20219.1 hypothetical protein SEA_SIXAMA_40 [Gordonia phage Sixama]